MNRRSITIIRIVVLIAVIGGLVMLFPRALAFVEMGAREIRYLWWLILLAAIGIWLIWGMGEKKK
jgi:uncharacterized membrane-anchored protein